MTMANESSQLALVDEQRRGVARSGEIVPMQPADLAAAIGGLLGDLAKAGSGFDDMSVRLTTETMPTGTKSTFDFRAYRHRRS